MSKYKVEKFLYHTGEYVRLQNSYGREYIFDSPENAWMGASYGFYNRYDRKDFPINTPIYDYTSNFFYNNRCCIKIIEV